MEARGIKYFFYTYLILTVIIIDFLTNTHLCSQIPVDLYNAISNIDYVSIILPTILDRRPAIFERRKILNSQPLPKKVIDALHGSMLGDGWLGFKKCRDPNPTGNARYSMSLKNHEYIMHLWSKIYSPICTSTVPCPRPNPKTGRPASSYNFKTLSLVPLTLLHKIWYSWSPELTKYVKILPLNIGELLTPIGLALWIQDDGSRDGNGLVLCTECFTLSLSLLMHLCRLRRKRSEVELLRSVLRDNFGLTSTIWELKQKGRHLGWRIYIRAENKDKLISLVKPYFVPSMLYKFGL